MKSNIDDQFAALREHLTAASEWPMGLTDADVERLGQGEPDGETAAWIDCAKVAREALRLLDLAVTSA